MSEFKTTANTGLLRGSINKAAQMGELADSSQFKLTLHLKDAGDITYLIRTTQTPEMKRQEIEDAGQFGLKFMRQGMLINSGQITFAFVDTIKGDALRVLRKAVAEKTYFDTTLELASEMNNGVADDPHIWRMKYCSVGLEAGDLDTEAAALFKPNGVLTYNWCEPEVGR